MILSLNAYLDPTVSKCRVLEIGALLDLARRCRRVNNVGIFATRAAANSSADYYYTSLGKVLALLHSIWPWYFRMLLIMRGRKLGLAQEDENNSGGDADQHESPFIDLQCRNRYVSRSGSRIR